MKKKSSTLHLKRLGINTYKEAIVYMRADCHVCKAEGFEAPSRIRVCLGDKSILATLNTIEDYLLQPNEAGLSNYAWDLLGAEEGQEVSFSHPNPLHSFSYVRSKIYGNQLRESETNHIIDDVAHGRYSDIHIATFLAACAGGRLNADEIVSLTRSMVQVGQRLEWPSSMVVDKHSVGGLPGNRTTPIVVPIIAAFGLTMPKTSSRAITSPAGTADTMEVLAPVDLDLASVRKVVEKENGCIVWGDAAVLSPADDVLIRVERVIDLDSEGQLIASVISKKIAAGSTHIVIDLPVGPTAKVRSLQMAALFKKLFTTVTKTLDINIKVIYSDGTQPIGRGIGPALEAIDVLSVLQCKTDAPQDLRDKALTLAGYILEFSDSVRKNKGKEIASEILDSGKAWKKFQAICDAQGGMREPTHAKYTHTVEAARQGKVISIDNRRLSHLAKLAGAPHDKAAGILLHAPLDLIVEAGQPLFTVHAESKGELRYALTLIEERQDIVLVEPYE